MCDQFTAFTVAYEYTVSIGNYVHFSAILAVTNIIIELHKNMCDYLLITYCYAL